MEYVLWYGPAFLDVGSPAGRFVPYALANLTPQWTMLVDAQHQPLLVAVLYDGHSNCGRATWLSGQRHFGAPAAQLTTTVRGALGSVSTIALIRKRCPSSVTA